MTLGENIQSWSRSMIFLNEPSLLQIQKIIAFWSKKYEPIEDEL